MKLNTKRTVLVGFAFLSICAFWQMYDNLIPKILTETFHMGESVSGMIMAADNILALFLLPLFGGLSDKCTSRLGRRRPYILFGTLAAVAVMMALPILTDSFHASPDAWKQVCFIIGLGILLTAMGAYRSPAVALMPDVTPKPLRSKANAIINLMGALGGIIYLIITTFLYKTTADVYVSYLPLFAIVGGIMLAALAVVMFCVDEPKLVAEQKRYEDAHPEDNLTQVTENGETLPKDVKRSLGFLLASIALWFIGYNGVTTWFSVYAGRTWHMTLAQANTCLTIATAGAILSYIPVGNRQLLCRVHLYHDVRLLQPGAVRPVCSGGHGMGGHQRQQSAHGGGNVQRQRGGQVYGTVLHLLHVRPDHDPHRSGLAAGACGL